MGNKWIGTGFTWLKVKLKIMERMRKNMARCTAPINGHRTASGRANCPACGGRYRNYDYYQTYSPSYASFKGSLKSNSGQTKTRARWSSGNSNVLYSAAEIRTLTPVRENVEKRSELPDLEPEYFHNEDSAVSQRRNGYRPEKIVQRRLYRESAPWNHCFCKEKA